MSDIGVAPAPSASPTPQATQTEVPINPNPVQSPAPVGSQAPDKPPVDMKNADHRKESIRQAFERAKARDPKDMGEPRQAKMGDNQPPEETKPERNREKPKSDPGDRVDLRKPPSDQPQPRERGRFAAKPREDVQPDAHGASEQKSPDVALLPDNTPYREPLPRMSPQAKSEWAKVPESVRGDAHRLYREFGQAYQQYRGDHEVMNTIRPFAEMAQQQGTTLERALTNYVSMEQKLRQDPVAGLDIIVHNLNLRSPDGQKLTLADVCWHILNQTPEQHKLTQSQNAQTAQSQQIGQLHQTVKALVNNQQQMQYAQKFGALRGAVDRYAETHPRIDELGPLIVREINLGFDLDEAYRRAELLSPGTAAQTRTTTAQTRTTDRSIHGAPASAPSAGAKQPRSNGKGAPSRRDAIANAMKRIGNSL